MPFSTCLPKPEIESTSLTSLALAGKIFTTSTTWEALSSLLAFSIFSFLLLPPWRRKWQPTLVLLPGKSHGWRILVGYSPWGRKELDMTEWLHFPSSWLPLFSSARDTFPRVLHQAKSWFFSSQQGDTSCRKPFWAKFSLLCVGPLHHKHPLLIHLPSFSEISGPVLLFP